MISVLISTPIPSPYQVELFDALAASRKVQLTVLYSCRTHSSRSWQFPRINHDYCVVGELSRSAARDLVLGADLSIFSGYTLRTIRRLIGERHASGKPWAVWGERPGVLLPQFLGRTYRRLVLPELRRSRASIWGIGSWAVEAYIREFGNGRHFANVPYFSNLDRFLCLNRTANITSARKFVFSGSLIKRKGVDLLASAFLDLAREFSDVELHLIGDGPLLEKLRATTAAIAERVHFHGFRQWDELPAYYSKADILCAPSRYDGWGLIVPEGLAAGLLVVSTNKTGSAVDLLDRSTGWVVPAGDEKALLAALREAANLPVRERISRIALGRSSAAQQNTDAGVIRVIGEINASLAHWNNASDSRAH